MSCTNQPIILNFSWHCINILFPANSLSHEIGKYTDL
uniref:Uncharacterized protein n=1 Tax=Nelumbo nucifera TaxID=4432 RepID=A0A822Y362_NELNU|nr:TPA_asm: hypothetical protein HUJ06_027891 [Nelumbo nucifera]